MFSAIARLLFGREEERTGNEDKEALPSGDEVDEGWLLLNNKGKWYMGWQFGMYIALLSKSVASHSPIRTPLAVSTMQSNNQHIKSS